MTRNQITERMEEITQWFIKMRQRGPLLIYGPAGQRMTEEYTRLNVKLAEMTPCNDDETPIRQ